MQVLEKCFKEKDALVSNPGRLVQHDYTYKLNKTKKRREKNNIPINQGFRQELGDALDQRLGKKRD